ncbi:endolytic transglycosylase MltG [bacterium]|nr:endolytic transglycosylase MltG [bacterium]
MDDASNLYNTRQNYGLTPTPISSPTSETINALLNYQKTSAIYYLHDGDGIIHYSDTLE